MFLLIFTEHSHWTSPSPRKCQAQSGVEPGCTSPQVTAFLPNSGVVIEELSAAKILEGCSGQVSQWQIMEIHPAFLRII